MTASDDLASKDNLNSFAFPQLTSKYEENTRIDFKI